MHAAALTGAQWLVGDGPSSVDAAAFGWLCAALYVVVPHRHVGAAMMRYPVLAQYVERVLRDTLQHPMEALRPPTAEDAAAAFPPPPSAAEEMAALQQSWRGKLVDYGVYALLAIGVLYIGYNASAHAANVKA